MAYDLLEVRDISHWDKVKQYTLFWQINFSLEFFFLTGPNQQTELVLELISPLEHCKK